jgi:hypothetical protein
MKLSCSLAAPWQWKVNFGIADNPEVRLDSSADGHARTGIIVKMNVTVALDDKQ